MPSYVATIAVLFGLLTLSDSVKSVAKQMKRQNLLPEAELRAQGVAIGTPMKMKTSRRKPLMDANTIRIGKTLGSSTRPHDLATAPRHRRDLV